MAKVYLIGAGPGDHKLITLKGMEAIKKAHVVLYDRLANPKLLKYAKEDAEIIYVGKAPNNHAYTQDEINELLVEKAKGDKIVARLKGGDPLVFGRGGEEAKRLFEENIDFEFVPGVTSAISVPAYAGIPVTHRNVSTSFHVITGSEDPTKEEKTVQYEALAKLEGTLIFLMGVKNLSKISTQLIKYGKDKNTPVAVIMRGSTKEQRMVKGTLENIYDIVIENNIKNPSIIIVGNVTNLSDTLRWFDKKELFGKKVLVTRTRKQASRLSEKLEGLGAETVEFPTIEIKRPDDFKEIDKDMKKMDTYDWIIFTSVNGVNSFFERMKALKMDIRHMGQGKICAIGPATKDALEEKGLIVEYMPDVYRAEAIVELIKDKIKPGEKVLLPRADIARTVLIEELKKLGAQVTNMAIYETIVPDSKREELIDTLQNNNIDIITFTSASTVRNFITILGEENKGLLKDSKLAMIGPITADAAKDLGLTCHIEADKYTIDGLVKAIRNYSEEDGKNA
ncbi:uroporphyrinogen-III C-methyltransferase [Anaeromicrobium sediminis]|uniref:uroporphyrinogen-III C-methyltransferase n=2 Tax=Anaeromicrobium sediminis TaxID=1478221 RepID=A0A267MMT1_9FIRM|nr:uroporphyrinogen-III C-methyltransferase [Anaeromicrobium sediminis]